MNKSPDKLLAVTPHTPFSLWDMVRFLPFEFHTSKFVIENLAHNYGISSDHGITETGLKIVLSALAILKNNCRRCGLDKAIAAIDGIEFELGFEEDYSHQKLAGLLTGMLKVMEAEFREQTFAFLPKSTARYFERDDLFGKHFHAAASDEINAEIRAAGNCLAAELNAAAAFYVLRACERGARRLARKLRVVVYRGNPIESY